MGLADTGRAVNEKRIPFVGGVICNLPAGGSCRSRSGRRRRSLRRGGGGPTVLPADRMGLTAKGRLEEGCDADITIFNPDTISDQEDFLALKRPEGIDYVIIGGDIALKDGEIVNGRKGRFIPFHA